MAVLALAGCGGGGGDSGGSAGAGGGGAGAGGGGGAGTAAVPTSGVYALDITAQGSASGPAFGVSLIHPAATGVEFVVEPTTAAISDAVVVSSGVVDGPMAKVSAIQPQSALYIASGEVRRVSLLANGTAPAAQVQKSATTGACRFQLQGNDYAAPDQSRYVVSTAGVDGVCGTADDGQAEVALGASNALSVAALSGGRRLGLVRDPSTLAPRGWYTPTAVVFWASSSTLPLQTTIAKVVLDTRRSALVENQGGGLGIVDLFVAAGGSIGLSQTSIDPALSAGTGWQPIGFDGLNYFVYRNSGSTPAGSTWSVLKIARQSGVVVQLASGAGLLSAAAMGVNVLFATESGAVTHRLLSFSKAASAQPRVLDTSATLVATVDASASGVHGLWRRDATTGAGSTVEYIDENGAVVFGSTGGGYPLGQPDPTALNFAVSENHTQFVFANGYGASGFAGATLQTFDAASATSVVLGTLPGATRFGADPVLVGISTTPASFTAGYAGRAPGGVLQASDEVAFSFDTRVAGSLRLTTSKQ